MPDIHLVYLPLSASNKVELEVKISEFVTDVVVVDGVVVNVEDVGLFVVVVVDVVVVVVKLVKYSLNEISSKSNLTIWEAMNSFS